MPLLLISREDGQDLNYSTLPETKTSQLKTRSWKTRFFLWWLPGMFYVSYFGKSRKLRTWCNLTAIPYLFFHIGCLNHQLRGEILTSIEPLNNAVKKPRPRKGPRGKNGLAWEQSAVSCLLCRVFQTRQRSSFCSALGRNVGTEGTRHLRKTPGSRAPQKEAERIIVFQASSFRCELLVSGRVEIIEFCEELGFPFMYWIGMIEHVAV